MAVQADRDASATSSWRGQLLSLVERATPRALSAVLLLMLAAVASPTVVGVYAIGILIYTAFLAVSDGAMRQVIVVALEGGESGARLMRRYQFWSGLIGLAVMSVGIALVGTVVDASPEVTVVGLAPLVLAPACRARGIVAVGRLQIFGHWRTLANGQLVASIASVAVAIPLVLLANPVFGACLQTLFAEAIFACWCRSSVLRVRADGTIPAVQHRQSLTRQFASMSVYSGLAWTQGQSDRALVGAFAGVARLGQFSLATALGRAVGDAIAASTANFLRASLRGSSDGLSESARAKRVLSTSVCLGLAATLVACAGAWVLHFILPERWDSTLDAMPIAGLVCVLAPLSWSGSVLQVRRGSTWTALLSPAAGIALSPVIAIGAAHDLREGAWLLLLREVVIVVVAFVLVGRRAPWRPLLLGVILTAMATPVAIAAA